MVQVRWILAAMICLLWSLLGSETRAGMILLVVEPMDKAMVLSAAPGGICSASITKNPTPGVPTHDEILLRNTKSGKRFSVSVTLVAEGEKPSSRPIGFDPKRPLTLRFIHDQVPVHVINLRFKELNSLGQHKYERGFLHGREALDKIPEFEAIEVVDWKDRFLFRWDANGEVVLNALRLCQGGIPREHPRFERGSLEPYPPAAFQGPEALGRKWK